MQDVQKQRARLFNQAITFYLSLSMNCRGEKCSFFGTQENNGYCSKCMPILPSAKPSAKEDQANVLSK
eukprot:7390490-Prymnesium_polylepis.1